MLGSELAAAQAEEERTRAEHPDLPSPLGVQYDFWAGELDLARLAPSPLDEVVQSLLHDFLALDPAGRARLRTSLTIDDLYTVLQFCRRATVDSLRTQDHDLARDALLAIALIDIDRVDWRDVPGPLELAAYAVNATGSDLQEQLTTLRSTAVEKVGSVAGRLQDPGVKPSVRSAGYAVVATEHGLGLVDFWGSGTESEAFARSLVRLADAIDAEGSYRTMSVKLSDDMPSVWFPKANRARVDELIEAAAAVGDLSAKHRPAPDSEAQQFMAFLLDAGSPGSAEELLHLTQGTPGLTHAQVALANGPLFVLVIARSWMQGVDAIETTESLARFRRPLLEALDG